MKILFVSQYFFPETFRGNDIAFELAKEHDVHVITATPNYPKGKFFDGYGWFKKSHEVVNGVRVTRIPVIPRGHNSIMLLLNYFSFMINACIYILFHAINHKYDRVFVQQLSPVMMSMPGILYKKLRKAPLFLWVLDLWPESLSAAGGINNKYILNFFDLFVKSEYKNADKILISSRSFEQSIMKYSNYSDKIIFYPQWAEDVFKHNDEKENKEECSSSTFKVMFAGNVGESQDFDHIMQAALETKDNKHIEWVIVGDGRKLQWVRDFVKTNDLDDTVTMTGRRPVEEMPSFFSTADVMLVTLKDTPIFRLTAPAKIQAYMSASKPIIGMISGEGSELIKEAKCGVCVPAESPNELAKVLTQLSTMKTEDLKIMGENGYQYYYTHFRKDICINNLKDIMNLN